MTACRIRILSEASAAIRVLPPELKRKVRSACDLIRRDPGAGKILVEELDGMRSFRAGHFRILYRLPSDGLVEIIAVGPRATVYLEAASLVARRRLS